MAPTPMRPATSPAPDRASERADKPRLNVIDIVLESLADAKAEDTVTINIAEKSSLADYMVVASGRSHRHVGAIADQLARALKDAGCGAPRIEGLPQCDWVLVDANDVIVHIFRPEVRDFYNIEKMWGADLPAEAH